MGFLGFAAKLSLPWILLAICCSYLIRLIVYLELNKRVYNHVPGICSAIAGVEDGAAGMTLIDSWTALWSSGLREYDDVEAFRNGTIKGKMYMYNFSANTAWELMLHGASIGKKSFNPHGVSSWKGKNGKTLVYVINHHRKGDRVEVFTLDKERHQLNHTRTLRDPNHQFSNLHDLVVVGTDKFFATNFHYFNDTRARRAELYLALRTGSIVYFNGTGARPVSKWLRTPNGIALDKTRRYLYVASTLNDSIDVFKIDSYINGTLEHYDSIELKTAPAGVFADHESGELWVAAHPAKFRYFMHENAPKDSMCPSQVLRLKGKPTRRAWTISEPYATDGAQLSCSSTVARSGKHMLAGSLHDKLMKCELSFPDQI